MKETELILIVCEGGTEALYFSILKKRFRLPTYIKIIPDVEKGEYSRTGQHEKLILRTEEYKHKCKTEYEIIDDSLIEAWAVCDRDNYKDSFTKLNEFAGEHGVNLAFSDPQFENFLLQHFSQNKSSSFGGEVERELSNCILDKKPHFGLYRKNDLSWLDEMIDEKHGIVKMAIKNASIFSNHTRKPFFTVQKLVKRLFKLVAV